MPKMPIKFYLKNFFNLHFFTYIKKKKKLKKKKRTTVFN